MKSISEIRFEAIPLGFNGGQVKLTDDNIGRLFIICILLLVVIEEMAFIRKPL